MLLSPSTGSCPLFGPCASCGSMRDGASWPTSLVLAPPGISCLSLPPGQLTWYKGVVDHFSFLHKWPSWLFTPMRWGLEGAPKRRDQASLLLCGRNRESNRVNEAKARLLIQLCAGQGWAVCVCFTASGQAGGKAFRSGAEQYWVADLTTRPGAYWAGPHLPRPAVTSQAGRGKLEDRVRFHPGEKPVLTKGTSTISPTRVPWRSYGHTWPGKDHCPALGPSVKGGFPALEGPQSSRGGQEEVGP